MKLGGFALVLILAIAGCVTPATLTPAGEAAPLGATLATALHPTEHRGSEPSIGITSDGTMFVLGSNQLLRSQDAGTSWDVVHDFSRFLAPGAGTTTYDPWLWVDAATDRVFVNHMWPVLTCSMTFWSDDGGESFSRGSPSCPSPTVDFQKLVTGPPGPEPNPDAGKAYERVAYLCYNKVVTALVAPVPAGRFGLSCAASYDGGASWKNERHLAGVAVVAGQEFGDCYGGSWGPAVAPDGTVVVRAQPDCMFRSRDSGASWEPIGTGPPFGGTQFAFDASGALYALSAYWEPPLRISRSLDQGETWEEPWVIQPPDVGTPAFTAIVAGDAGRVAVAFLGTADDAGYPADVDEDARWHAWFVTTQTGLDAQPTFVATRATADDAPMHIGCIARSAPCPWMGDFASVTMAPDGTPYAVFPDTCNEKCEGNPSATTKESRLSLSTVVGLHGWRLKIG